MTACMTIGTGDVTCFKQPYKLFPWSFQESPGKCFFDNCQPKTSHPDCDRHTCSSAQLSVRKTSPVSADTSANAYKMCVSWLGSMSVGSVTDQSRQKR